jgi:hypothetical protein
MNVTQLRETLEYLETLGQGEMEVQFSYNSGDYWNTKVAVGIDAVEVATVLYSDYHSKDKVIEYDDPEDADESEVPAGARTVIMLG